MNNLINKNVRLIIGTNNTVVKGVVIYQNDNIINLEDVTIIRKKEIVKHKQYGVPTCYINSIEIQEIL